MRQIKLLMVVALVFTVSACKSPAKEQQAATEEKAEQAEELQVAPEPEKVEGLGDSNTRIMGSANDYEATWEPRNNLFGGYWDNWRYRAGDCKLERISKWACALTGDLHFACRKQPMWNL